VWSDGSVQTAPPFKGWGAAHILLATHRVPDKAAEAAGLNCFPFFAECVALRAGLRNLYNGVASARIPEGYFRDRVVLLYKYGQSLVQALKSGPLAQTEPVLGDVWRLLSWLVSIAGARQVLVQWVPGDVGMQQMEAVDAYAKEQHRNAARQGCDSIRG
jgi:hypothetical protein